MKHIAFALAVAAGTALVSSAPASAQVYPGRVYSVADILPPHEISAVVREAGFRPISPPIWRPGRYIVRAIDRSGRMMRVVVDARMGEVIRAVPVGTYADVGPRSYEPYPPRSYEPYPPRRYAYPPETRMAPPAEVPDPEYGEAPDYDDGDLPPPDATPRVIPGPRSALPPSSKTAALAPKPDVKKPATPLPRARPDMTASIPVKPAEPEKPAASAPPVKPEAKSSPASDKPAQKDAKSSPAPEQPEKKDIRVIDMSKPKPAETPDAKTAAADKKTSPVEAKTPAPTAKPVEDTSQKPRF